VSMNALFCYTTLDLRVGKILLIASPRGLSRVVLGPNEPTLIALERVSAVAPQLLGRRGSPILVTTKRGLKRYFNGRKVNFSSVPLDLAGASDFQMNVWKLISEIPYGSVRSYRWVAERLGGADYARAVGQALARNPVPVIVPCHRVIEESGDRGGYTGGVRWKGALLELEGGEQRLRWREARRRHKL
jgi:methylated-DNA-[protein]-cysteine S-methyltransferase